MCFTPIVSIGTAVVEFSIVVYLKKIIKDPRLRLGPVFIFLLGFYQFTEFMLCETSNAEVWSRLGFIAYTFMPLVFAHFILSVSGKKTNRFLYVIPILFSSIAILHPNFIIQSSCNFLHVTSLNILYDQYRNLSVIYFLYYTFFPAVALYFFAKKYKDGFFGDMRFGVVWSLVSLALLLSHLFIIYWGIKEFNMTTSWLIVSVILFLMGLVLFVLVVIPFYRKRLFVYLNLLIFASVAVLVPILYSFFPIVGYNFPSIFCQFAFLYSIAILIFINIFQEKVNNN